MADAEFCNWIAHDAVYCLEHLLALGEDPEPFRAAYEALNGHPCLRTCENASRNLAGYFGDPQVAPTTGPGPFRVLCGFYYFYSTYSEEKHRAPGSADELREYFRGNEWFEQIPLDRLRVQWGTPLGEKPRVVLATLDEGRRPARSVFTDGWIVPHEPGHLPDSGKT
jgi:hypothetical protein